MKLDDNINKIFNSSIRVLIVDDEYTNTEEMIAGLEEFNLDSKNIFPNQNNEKELQNFSKLIKKLAEEDILKLYTLLKSIIQIHEIDILFLDLHLGCNDEAGGSTGEKIIEMFVDDEYYYSIFPIVVVSVFSKDELKKGSPVLAPMMHIKKPNISFDRDVFKKAIENEKLNEYWINIIKNYRKVRDSKEHKENTEFIKNRLNKLNNEDKLDNILFAIDGINEKLLLSKEKLKTIEIFSKSIVTVLPQLAEKKHIKTVIDKLDTKELREILGDGFPEAVSDSIYNKIKEKVSDEKDAFIEDIYSEIKDLVKDHIKKEAGITQDNDIIEKTGKLTIYLYGKIISTLLGKL